MNSAVQQSLPAGKLAEFCRRWKIREMAVFGSALREDFRPDSDIDIVVDFLPETQYTLLDLADIHDDLQSIFGREIDLVTRSAIEGSRNVIRRDAILSSLEVIYAA